jgi:transposase
MINLTTSDIADSAGPQAILEAIRTRWSWVKHLLADGAYDRRRLMDKAAFKDLVIEIIRRINADPGFKVLPRRWVLERTFARVTRWRRLLARDYEKCFDVSKAMIHVALDGLLLRRVVHQ